MFYCVCFSRIEHLKSQNDLLTITLEECKTNAERMSMLVGKYESNATALRLALQYRYRHANVTRITADGEAATLQTLCNFNYSQILNTTAFTSGSRR